MKNALKITSLSSIELYKRDFQLTESDGQNWSPKSLKHPPNHSILLIENAQCAKSGKKYSSVSDNRTYTFTMYGQMSHSIHMSSIQINTNSYLSTSN